MTHEENQSESKKYYYRRCPTCGVKIHIDAYRCWKCNGIYNQNEKTGKWNPAPLYETDDEQNAILCTPLNDVEKCFKCRNTIEKENPCKYTFCFGRGGGKCDLCQQFNYVRFNCCQDVLKAEKNMMFSKAEA